MVYINSDIFYCISCYLTDFEIAFSLDSLCSSSNGLIRNKTLARIYLRKYRRDRLLFAADNGYADGIIHYLQEPQFRGLRCMGKAIMKACMKGHIDTAKLIYNYNPSHRLLNTDTFPHVVRMGHLDCIKWWYDIKEVHLNDDRKIDLIYSGISTACIKGKLKAAQLLYSMHPIPQDTINNLFRIVCEYDRVEEIKWLHKVGSVDSNYTYGYIRKILKL